MRQHGILEHAARLVRPGGRLVYSTCTFAPRGGRGRHRALSAMRTPSSSWRSRPADRALRRDDRSGLPPELRRPELARCVRLWPHTGRARGTSPRCCGGKRTLRLLRRRGSGRRRKPDRDAEAAFAAFVGRDIPAARSPRTRCREAARICTRCPPGLPDLTGLRYLHAGWWLGELKGGERGRERFEPSHALALAAQPLPVRRVARFSAGEPALAAYLGGETVTSAGEDGWTLVCVDGYGIGWAKRVGGRLKSHYPKGLRP